MGARGDPRRHLRRPGSSPAHVREHQVMGRIQAGPQGSSPRVRGALQPEPARPGLISARAGCTYMPASSTRQVLLRPRSHVVRANQKVSPGGTLRKYIPVRICTSHVKDGPSAATTEGARHQGSASPSPTTLCYRAIPAGAGRPPSRRSQAQRAQDHPRIHGDFALNEFDSGLGIIAPVPDKRKSMDPPRREPHLRAGSTPSPA